MQSFFGFLNASVASFFVHCHSTDGVVLGDFGRVPAVLEHREHVLGLRLQLKLARPCTRAARRPRRSSVRRFWVVVEYRPICIVASPTYG